MAGVGSNFGDSSNSLLSELRDLGEKLKCFVCKGLLQQPTSMACGHVFCMKCLPIYLLSACPKCKARCLKDDNKPAVHIEEMLKKYQEMEASIKVQNSDNVSQVGAFTEESRPILTPQSNQRGSGLVMNNSCPQDLTQSGQANLPTRDKVLVPPVTPGFRKRTHELGIKSSSKTASTNKLARGKLPQDSSAVVLTPAKSSTTPGPSQIHVPALEKEFRLRHPNLKVRAGESSSKDSGQPCMNPSTSRKKRTHRKEWAGPFAKRLMLLASPVPVGLYEDECIFCHSFRRDLEGFGKLLCIQKEKVVCEPDNASKARVLYAHQECLYWAPRICQQGDQLINLRNEIRRSTKLKCAKCSRNGAALGCYYEPCPKSYHPSCAFQVRGCRWDTENRWMLCPDHACEKFPCNSDPKQSDLAAKESFSRPSEREESIN